MSCHAVRLATRPDAMKRSPATMPIPASPSGCWLQWRSCSSSPPINSWRIGLIKFPAATVPTRRHSNLACEGIEPACPFADALSGCSAELQLEVSDGVADLSAFVSLKLQNDGLVRLSNPRGGLSGPFRLRVSLRQHAGGRLRCSWPNHRPHQ